LNEKFDLTTIIVTHDPRIAGQVDRVVAIRDGKTSTETIRQVSQLEQAMVGDRPSDTEKAVKEEVTYQEYVVLDSAGRLQVPRDILEKLNIGKRAELEMGDNCILIRPVAGQSQDASSKQLTLEAQLAMLFEDVPPVPAKKRNRLDSLKPRVRK
jgi:ABC-type sulfate/molybdate transport systems ATPase subunit